MDVQITMETNNVGLIFSEKDAAIERALTIIGIKAEAYAKKALTDQKAVDTGRLRNSVANDHDQNTVYVGTNVEYAPYIEMGTSRMAARPYLEPSIANHIDEYKDIIYSELKK